MHTIIATNRTHEILATESRIQELKTLRKLSGIRILTIAEALRKDWLEQSLATPKEAEKKLNFNSKLDKKIWAKCYPTRAQKRILSRWLEDCADDIRVIGGRMRAGDEELFLEFDRMD